MTQPLGDPICALQATTIALLAVLRYIQPEKLTEEDRAKLRDCMRELAALLGPAWN
jgi:hypothetical protein